MSSLFGILQLDRGDPWGYAQIPGLIQAWIQDAGGFAALGLVFYLAYALSTPTDKSQSEKLRVPVSKWMLWMAALALVTYAMLAASYTLTAPTVNLGGKTVTVAQPEPPPPQPGDPIILPPPSWRWELRPMLLMIGGLFAVLGIGEPFARDLFKIARRNLSFGFTGLRRFGTSLRQSAAELLTPRRVTVLIAAVAAYGVFGAVLFALGVTKLTAIWLGVLYVGLGVFVCALALLLLFEAEGPVWAIAKLSFKEAVRSQFLWVFLIVFLPFLFPLQTYAAGRASDALRSTTGVVTILLALLALVPAVLLTSFGIPNDIKNWNIFTVVSKPVERFEIVLGRFVGYLALMTLVLLGLSGVSVVMVANTAASAPEKARDETYKARVPLRGKLEFKSWVAQDRMDKTEFTGTNVGREFDYRRYISGDGKRPDGSVDVSPQRAIWHFDTIPADLTRAEGDRVPVEFTFDIYKMTKGEQNRGAFVSFVVVTHNAPQKQPRKDQRWDWVDEARKREYLAAKRQFEEGQNLKLDGARPGDPGWAAVNELAEKYGYYELSGKEVFDYQVGGVDLPAGLFRNAMKGDPGKDSQGRPLPRVTIYVKCDSPGQLLGAAAPDLYVLRSELPYELNFLKAMIGLWCQLAIVIGLAVALSTYLSGILSLLVTATIFITGFFTDHLNDLAYGRNIGGGPFESMSRLVKAEQPTAPGSDSAGSKALMFFDRVWAWAVRRIQNLIPDVESYSWSHFVSEGFNISAEYLVVNVLVTFGYLLPWGILAYYLMKSREVAA